MTENAACGLEVLVVEDEDDIAAVIQTALEQEGFAVRRAADGKAALALIERMPTPALVTLDIRLPDMSGVDLIIHIKEKASWRRVPVVMVTATPKDEAVNWAIQKGAKAYLVKPFDPDELRACARRLARRPDAA